MYKCEWGSLVEDKPCNGLPHHTITTKLGAKWALCGKHYSIVADLFNLVTKI